ncbi:hypothetical protein [Mycobacteroides abscessus]
MTKLNLYRGSGDIPTFDHYGLISLENGWASGACQYGQDLHVIGHVGEALFEWEISDPKSASVASTMLNTRGTFDVVTAGMSSESNGKIYLALNNSKDAFDLGPLQFFSREADKPGSLWVTEPAPHETPGVPILAFGAPTLIPYRTSLVCVYFNGNDGTLRYAVFDIPSGKWVWAEAVDSYPIDDPSDRRSPKIDTFITAGVSAGILDDRIVLTFADHGTQFGGPAAWIQGYSNPDSGKIYWTPWAPIPSGPAVSGTVPRLVPYRGRLYAHWSYNEYSEFDGIHWSRPFQFNIDDFEAGLPQVWRGSFMTIKNSDTL